jgi:hypothetical protein
VPRKDEGTAEWELRAEAFTQTLKEGRVVFNKIRIKKSMDE